MKDPMAGETPALQMVITRRGSVPTDPFAAEETATLII